MVTSRSMGHRPHPWHRPWPGVDASPWEKTPRWMFWRPEYRRAHHWYTGDEWEYASAVLLATIYLKEEFDAHPNP